jgi:hypothetical protein
VKDAKKCIEKLKKVVAKLVEQDYPLMELEFLEEGIREIIHVKRILAWTYAYGYFLKEEIETNLLETI